MRIVIEILAVLGAFYLGLWRGKAITHAAYDEAAKLVGAVKGKL